MKVVNLSTTEFRLFATVEPHAVDELLEDEEEDYDDEEDEQRHHLKEEVGKGIKQEAEGYLKQTHPFGSPESLGLIEGKVLIGTEYVDADR